MTKMIDDNTRLIDATLLLEGVDALLKEVDSGAVEILEAVRLGIIAQPTIDAVEVVRCEECKWYDPPHILYNDGTRKNVGEDELNVTADVGINCSGRCMAHNKTYCTSHNREDPEDRPNIVIFRMPSDFCSYGEREDDDEEI